MGQVRMIYTHPIYRQRGANTTSTPDMCKSVAGSKQRQTCTLGSDAALVSLGWNKSSQLTRLLSQAFAMPMLTTSSARHTRNGRTASRISIKRNLSTKISLWSTVPSPISFLPTTSTRWLEGLIRIFSSPRHYIISFQCFSVWSHADYEATSTSHGDLILRIPLHPFAWEIPGDGTKAGIWNVVILVEGKQNLHRTTKKKLTIPTSGTSFRGYLHVRSSFSYVILIKSIMCKWKANGQNSKMKKTWKMSVLWPILSQIQHCMPQETLNGYRTRTVKQSMDTP